MGNDFLNRTPRAQETAQEWDCIKLKSFYTSKETSTRIKDSSQNEKKSLPASLQTKEQYLEYIKSSKN
jgi:hypothetical protein